MMKGRERHMKVLVTGAAGFIGFHLVKRLLQDGHTVVGLDNMNDYYDVSLKQARLDEISKSIQKGPGPFFQFVEMDLVDGTGLMALFATEKFDYVLHMAAQAGVRYSLEQPMAYVNSNVVGFTNLLEACRAYPPKHVLYASSSSVYGANTKVPFAVEDRVDQPISLYAATKKSNELFAYTYAHLFGLKLTGLRFFTVYGPWGRPDMATYLFTDAMVQGKPIKVFNGGEMSRDFTYIDDIVDGVMALMGSNSLSKTVYNLGNHQPVALLEFIRILERELGVEAVLDMQPMQPGDVESTYADIEASTRDFGFTPRTDLATGLRAFVSWYKTYKNLN
jgi:UDP-glucuronate 4-epimerase